jgi:hypothetical protein
MMRGCCSAAGLKAMHKFDWRHWPKRTKTLEGQARKALANVPTRAFRRTVSAAVPAALLALLGTNPVHAQGKLDAHYAVTLGGIPLAKGAWLIEVAEDQYSLAGSGMTTGLVKAVTGGEGSVAAHGVIRGRALNPAGYAVSITAGKRREDIEISLAGGNVKDFSITPTPPPPSPGSVPVTDAHRRGVTDPLSAAIVQVSGNGELLTPGVCDRRVAIFDGRMRYELEFAFKRMDQVKAEKGYRGPALVCSVKFSPVAGHNPERLAIKYLVKQSDMEVWLAPISGTRVLAPFRFSMPTPLGAGILQATEFVASPLPSRASIKLQ